MDNQEGANRIPHTFDFEEVLGREYAAIRQKRAGGNAPPAEDDGSKAPEALFGVALSGGGIRSASYCLGALQALHKKKLIDRIDYLSTVSGGGYTGASVISAMTQNGRKFPFSSEDVARDIEPISHLRDNSRFLAPRGLPDILLSLAVVLRGLVVNAILVLALILPVATLLILANPTSAHLERSIILDVTTYWLSDAQRQTPLYLMLEPYIADPFLMTKGLALALFLILFAWALYRSFWALQKLRPVRWVPEHHSKGARLGSLLVRLLVVALFLELQPPILSWLITILQPTPADFAFGPATASITGTIGTIAAAVVALTATFRTTFVGWITKALNAPTVGAWIKAAFARTLIYTAGLVLPLMIYGVFLLITLWGIEPGVCVPVPLAETAAQRVCACQPDVYAFTPSIVAVDSATVAEWTFSLLLFVVISALFVAKFARDGLDVLVALVCGALAIAVLNGPTNWVEERLRDAGGPDLWSVVVFSAVAVLIGKALLPELFPADIQPGWRQRLRALFLSGWGWTAMALIAVVVLAMAAIAVRGAGAPVEWTVLSRYVLTLAIVWSVGWQFAENANGLHRLYRDRIAAAFRLDGVDHVPLLLSKLDSFSPYLLVNATLNARLSADRRDANPQADPAVANPLADPAKRGRNADFFLFSRLHVGSASTGYAETRAVEEVDARMDLATAVAISGAAVSSSMGRISTGLLAPTLALLNLRLGYWLTNPRLSDPVYAFSPERRAFWYDRFRLYLLAEAFGLLRTTSPLVYVTDGGHIDNIGLYQLLKRRCRYIVVVDGEADPAMNFGALSDVQRFARIDEGVRIKIDWMPIRDAALERMADKTKRPAEDEDKHDRHFAIGKIFYEHKSGEIDEGLLVYVKASMTGDEPDYVLDYERRYPAFPHESTGDQFFSEEQMEAYRALGYHCVERMLQGANKVPLAYADSDGEERNPVAHMIRELKATATVTRPYGGAAPAA